MFDEHSDTSVSGFVNEYSANRPLRDRNEFHHSSLRLKIDVRNDSVSSRSGRIEYACLSLLTFDVTFLQLIIIIFIIGYMNELLPQ